MGALIRAGLVEASVMQQRCALLPDEHAVVRDESAVPWPAISPKLAAGPPLEPRSALIHPPYTKRAALR